MKPSRLLLAWLGALLGLGVLLGALKALNVGLPDSLDSIGWGLLLALLLLAALDAVRLQRLPSPRLQRRAAGTHQPGAGPLG